MPGKPCAHPWKTHGPLPAPWRRSNDAGGPPASSRAARLAARDGAGRSGYPARAIMTRKGQALRPAAAQALPAPLVAGSGELRGGTTRQPGWRPR